jgi:hypothetical protein
MATRHQTSAISYRFQRYHHALMTGKLLLKQSKRQDPVRVFYRQGDLDSYCGLAVFSMVLVIFDLAKSVALQDMARRKYGTPSEVWAALGDTAFTGIRAADFVQRVDSLKLPLSLTLREANTGSVDRWVVDCLMAGELVALVTASAKNTGRNQHWTLAVGIEGNVSGREHQPDTILVLDPSGSDPCFRPHNARMAVPATGVGSRSGKTAESLYKLKSDDRAHRVQWLYVKPICATCSNVSLTPRSRSSRACCHGTWPRC